MKTKYIQVTSHHSLPDVPDVAVKRHPFPVLFRPLARLPSLSVPVHSCLAGLVEAPLQTGGELELGALPCLRRVIGSKINHTVLPFREHNLAFGISMERAEWSAFLGENSP